VPVPAPVPTPIAAPSPQIARADPASPGDSAPAERDAAEDAPANETNERPPAPFTGPNPPARPSSIGESLRNLEDRLAEGPVGLESGAGQQMGDLFFDPQGADFTAWANTMRIEVHRNWIVPQSVRFGARGHVSIEFRIERDGTLSALRIVRESGTPALDRAAVNALRGARFLPLPADYRPAQLAIQVTFFYNEGRR
jgi:protein TonB